MFNYTEMLMREPFGMDREKAEQYGHYLTQLDARYQGDIRKLEEKVKEADRKAQEWEKFYDRLLDRVVELEVANKVLQKEIENGN
jgi:hypothetical protein